MSRKNTRDVMIATLGSEPQVITYTLDILGADHKIDEVVVIHTDDINISRSIGILHKEFTNAYPDVALRPVLITGSSGPVKDFLTQDDLNGLLGTLYIEVRRIRQSGRRIHMCISGGRKVMAVLAMCVAQLLFGPSDHVWYLITEGWRPGGEQKLHAGKSDKTFLLPVPVLRWNEAEILLRTVAELKDPNEVIAWYKKLTHRAEEKRNNEFVRHWLTRAEREVVRLACLGFDNATIAAKLGKSEQTVANQLRGVYEKLRELLGFPEYTVERNVLSSRLAPYFSLN